MPDRSSRIAGFLVLFLLLLSLGAFSARGQSSSESFTLQVQRVGAGGGSASSASFTDDAMTGQAAVGPSTSASFRTGSGFTYPLDPDNEPLPVELTRFDAAVEDKAVRLTWRTASETNNSGFAVQHQPKGREVWERLGFVESKATGGTTTEAKRYRFDAEDLKVGTHRFRLKQVDLSGASTLSDPVTAEIRMEEALRLSVPAPNPVRSVATLSFAVREATETRIALYNVLGQKVRTLYRDTPPAGEAQTVRLNVAGVPSGTYFLRLRAGDRTATQRLTVVR